MDSIVTGDESNADSSDGHSEVFGMSDFPFDHMRSALISAINDATTSGKGLIVLHATSFVPYWKGYLRHLASVSSNSNSSQLSKLVLVCDSSISDSSLRMVSAWSRVIFWNFPCSCECLDAFGTGLQFLWLSNELRQEDLDSKKLQCEILSVGKVAVSFQERLFLRISTCLMSFAMALHARSSIESGFWTGQQTFDAQLFLNHSFSVAVSMLSRPRFYANKAAFCTHGIPWLKHQVIFGCGAVEFASKRDIVQIMSIFDSLISSDIVSDAFTLPFLEADVFPALSQTSEMSSLVASLSERRNYADDVLLVISKLNVSEWNRLQYNWTQRLLRSCIVRNIEENGDFVSPVYSSKAEVMKLLLHVQVAIPSREVFSSLLDSNFKSESGRLTEQLFCVAVAEAKLFVTALKQTVTLIQHMLENLSRRSTLSLEQDADLQFLMCNCTPERWCKSFGFSKIMQIPKFINHITDVGSFWSSWPAYPTLPAVLCANAFSNFGRVLHFLALEQSLLSGCDGSKIKCVVLPETKQSVFAGIKIKGLTGRGFSWNGKVASPLADLQSSSEESSAQFKRQIAPSDLVKRSSKILLAPIAEVSVCAMSPEVLRECMPQSTATLRSIPILRDGCDSSEVDQAPSISFLFDEPTNDNFMCVFS